MKRKVDQVGRSCARSLFQDTVEFSTDGEGFSLAWILGVVRAGMVKSSEASSFFCPNFLRPLAGFPP